MEYELIAAVIIFLKDKETNCYNSTEHLIWNKKKIQNTTQALSCQEGLAAGSNSATRLCQN